MTGRILAALGVWSARRPWRVLCVWLVVLAGAVVLEPVFAARQTAITYAVDGSQSARVEELLRTRFPGRGAERDLVVLSSPGASITEPAQRGTVEHLLDRLSREPEVVRVLSPYAGPGLVAADATAAVATVALRGGRAEIQRRAPRLQRLLDEQTRGTQVRAYLVGYGPIAQAVVDAETAGASRAECLGVPIALIVLLLALGTVVAALLPIATGGLGVLLAFGILGAASLAAPLNGILSAVVPMIGLGVGIDYAMFIVTRFRESLSGRRDRRAVADAIAGAMRTSGSTVLFSGLVVMMCLLTLTVIPAQTFRHLALGMTLAVATAVLTVLTLLPAVLGLLGERVERAALPWRDRVAAGAERPDALLARWARTVMRHPLPATAVTVAVLLLAAVPVLHLRLGIDLGTSGLGDSAAGRGRQILTQQFSANTIMPLDVIYTPGEATALTERIRGIAGVAEVLADPADTSVDGRSAYLSVVLGVPPDSPEALDVVRELRTLPLQVGGPTAEFLDLSEQTRDRTWLVIGLVLGLSFLFLTVVFRSLLLPLKAVAMNLLATGAAYGMLVRVFQDGHLARPLGFVSSGSVQVYLPLRADRRTTQSFDL